MAAQHFDHPAVRSLIETAAAEFLRQAGPEHAKFAQPIDYALRNFGIAIDRGRIDAFAAVAAQVGDHLAGPRILIEIGIGQQLLRKVLAKKQSLGKSHLVHAIAKHLLRLGHLLLVIHFHALTSQFRLT